MSYDDEDVAEEISEEVSDENPATPEDVEETEYVQTPDAGADLNRSFEDARIKSENE